jgi:hypothetical protein
MIGMLLEAFMDEHTNKAPVAPGRVHEIIATTWLAFALRSAVILGLPELVAARPRTLLQLASQVEARPEALSRLMRPLVKEGFFEWRSGEYILGPFGHELLPDDPESSHASLVLQLGDEHVASWEGLMLSLQTGRTAFNTKYQQPVWDFYRDKADVGHAFQEAMAEDSRRIWPAIRERYDFSRFESIVDVGGGYGALLIEILREYPAVQGVLFDLRHVVRHAFKRMQFDSLRKRLRFAHGSFFEELPSGHALYLLKWIMHDWDDADARQILTKVREAIPAQGRVLLIETIIDEERSSANSLLMDLLLMVMNGGRERTLSDWQNLITGTGLRISEITGIENGLSLIELEPV